MAAYYRTHRLDPSSMQAGDDETRTVLLAIAGSDAAYEDLVRRYQGRIVNLLWRVCGDAGVAEDLTQTAFVNAWRQIGALRDASAFLPWLRRIALNAAIDAARRGKVAVEPVTEETVASVATPRGDSSDRRLDINAAMARLSFAQRACVLSSLVEGMSHSEISEALAMPIGTVKSHIARALPLLRSWLKDWKDD